MSFRPAPLVAAGWLVAALLARGAAAETWGGITPGVTTGPEVRTRYGSPSRERLLVEEGRTVPEWTYAGAQAPRGLDRMVISFGLLQPAGFRADLVRAVTLHPRPRIFSLQAILNGWGQPDGIGTEEATGRPSLHYGTRGLLVILDRAGEWAEVMLFAPAAP
jgi:hypothetical protein